MPAINEAKSIVRANRKLAKKTFLKTFKMTPQNWEGIILGLKVQELFSETLAGLCPKNQDVTLKRYPSGAIVVSNITNFPKNKAIMSKLFGGGLLLKDIPDEYRIDDPVVAKVRRALSTLGVRLAPSMNKNTRTSYTWKDNERRVIVKMHTWICPSRKLVGRIKEPAASVFLGCSLAGRK